MARKEKGMSYSNFLRFLDVLPTIDAFTLPTARPPMSDKKFQLMYKMMFYCGLKSVECFELKKSDVDLEHYELSIRKKSGGVEKTTLPPTLSVSYGIILKISLHKDYFLHPERLQGNLVGLFLGLMQK